ncbi:MAG: excinuclease subunit, partial [Solirubrobacteraceae bacterium]|nr:excinuclease subunit [Solirubrobacteraceae bacterium]
MPPFKLDSVYSPTADQPKAIAGLAEGIEAGERFTTLLGATGTGKTMTMAATIEAVQKPALILAHNKTLAAQLCNEFRTYFPSNSVEYFVSYYDYYQPEAYVPSRDLYIEKDSAINQEIDRLRHAATASLFARRDVVIVASVSAIFGLGSPQTYNDNCQILVKGGDQDRDELLRKLVSLQYTRNDTALGRGTFRVRGDTLEVFPAYAETAFRASFFGDEVERLQHFDPLTGELIVDDLEHVAIWPASHYNVREGTMERAVEEIGRELNARTAELEAEGKLLESHRLRQRTQYDMEMLREVGFCSGIENYSRILDGRPPGSRPYCLIDYFPDDFVCFLDESHQTTPQIGGMYEGDRSRKQTLVDYGFRLPSAMDNRPQTFDEFLSITPQIVFVSATPGKYERDHSARIVEQIVRPTGVVDPAVEVRETRNQIDDLMNEIRGRVERDERVLVTTLTKKMSEDLTDYLLEMGFKVRYLHSEIDTLERIQIIRELRLGEYDVLVGVNLLREGLDLPEVSLVAILDADKEGFLRGETSLIQTIGRAARNVDGKVLMYADKETAAMRTALDETDRRRAIQVAYNEEHGITAETIVKGISDISEFLMQEGKVPSKRRRKRQRETDMT